MGAAAVFIFNYSDGNVDDIAARSHVEIKIAKSAATAQIEPN